MVLRNTYINALLLSDFTAPETAPKAQKPSAVKWADTIKPEKNKTIATVINDKPIHQISVHKTIPKNSLKSIINKTEIITTNPYVFHEEERIDMAGADVFAVPVKERKRKEVDNKIYMKQGKSPFKKAKTKKLENERKYGSDTLKKIQPDFFPDVWRTNIIIQNPQKVEFNTFISRDVVNHKKANKVLFYLIIRINKDLLVLILELNHLKVSSKALIHFHIRIRINILLFHLVYMILDRL